MEKQTALLVEMLQQNNKLTEQVSTLLATKYRSHGEQLRSLVERVQELTADVLARVVANTSSQVR